MKPNSPPSAEEPVEPETKNGEAGEQTTAAAPPASPDPAPPVTEAPAQPMKPTPVEPEEPPFIPEKRPKIVPVVRLSDIVFTSEPILSDPDNSVVSLKTSTHYSLTLNRTLWEMLTP